MADNDADFTLTFYYLSQLGSQVESQSGSQLESQLSAGATEQDSDIRALFNDPEQFDQWALKWRKRLTEETLCDDDRQAMMQAVNPVYIPRNHQIEAAIRAAEDKADFSVFHDLHEVLQNPYQRQQGKDVYMLPPEPDEIVAQTFCGT